MTLSSHSRPPVATVWFAGAIKGGLTCRNGATVAQPPCKRQAVGSSPTFGPMQIWCSGKHFGLPNRQHGFESRYLLYRFEVLEMTQEEWAVIKAYIRPCPACGSRRLWLNKIITAPFGTIEKAPHKWWVECSECHWCGKTKWLAYRAINAWQEERYEDRCKRNA